jgi:hypothetical protein
VVSGKNNVRLASSDILLPGPFKQMDVIQEERVEAVTKTIDGVKNKSTKATTPDKGNIINNGEQGEGVQKEVSIQDKSPTDKLPTRLPSLTGLQNEMTKKLKIVAIKMVAGRRNTYYHRYKKRTRQLQNVPVVVLFHVYWKQASSGEAKGRGERLRLQARYS